MKPSYSQIAEAISLFSRRGQSLIIDRELDKFTVSGPCVFSGSQYQVSGKLDQLFDWRSGTLIQKAFPNMSADDREFLISGISPEGWNATFRKESSGKPQKSS